MIVDKRVDQLKNLEEEILTSRSIRKTFRLMYERNKLSNSIMRSHWEAQRDILSFTFFSPSVVGKA
jgi:hypothetical protein